MDIDKAIKIVKGIGTDFKIWSERIIPSQKYFWEKGKAVDNVLAELETSNKINKKLAEQIKREVVFYDSQGFSHCDIAYEKDYTKHGKCENYNNGTNCIQCIIDTARKEVANE